MHVHRSEKLWMAFGIAMLVVFLGTITFAAVVDGIVPPSHVQSIDPTKVSSTPPFDKPGLRKVGNKQYEAYYVARIFQFVPKRLEIPDGSHVKFFVTSGDVEHGFSI